MALRIPPETTARQVDFVVERLELAPGTHVLDLACGHGRHSIELARRGMRVTGLDLSAPSLEIARRHARDAEVDVEFVQQDMRDLAAEARFDAVVNLFTAFGYFADEADDARVIEHVGRALRPGGRFLVDLLNPLWLARNYQPKVWDELEEGMLFLEEREWDSTTWRNSAVWTFVRPSGERSELRHPLRVYSFPEFATQLRAAGLEPERAWGSFDGEEYGLDARRMIVVARRAAETPAATLAAAPID